MNWSYCTGCRWIKLGDHKIVNNARGKQFVIEKRGHTEVAHTLITGIRLKRLMLTDPPPKEFTERVPIVTQESLPRPAIEVQPVEAIKPVTVKPTRVYAGAISNVMHGKVIVVPIPGETPGQILSEGYRYIVFQDDVQGDVYGRQYLILGEEVEFRPGTSKHGNKQAVYVRPIGRPEEVRDHDYREDAYVNEWFSNGTGFATRMTGESVHVSVEDAITEGELRVGVYIRMKPCPPSRTDRKMFRAKEIEIYKD